MDTTTIDEDDDLLPLEGELPDCGYPDASDPDASLGGLRLWFYHCAIDHLMVNNQHWADNPDSDREIRRLVNCMRRDEIERYQQRVQAAERVAKEASDMFRHVVDGQMEALLRDARIMAVGHEGMRRGWSQEPQPAA